MNAIENIDSLVRNKDYERIGVFDHFWAEALQNWTEQGKFPSVGSEGGRETPGDVDDHFSLDMRVVWGVVDHLPMRGHSETVDESDEWIVTRNGAGAALKHWKYRTGTPEHIDFLMTGRDIWDRDYRELLVSYDPDRLHLKEAARSLDRGRSKDQWTFYGDLFVWEVMRQSMGDFCMYESLLLDPDWIKDFNRVYTDFYKIHYSAILEELPKPDGIWIYEDLGYKNGLFCSLEIVEELLLPYYREIVDFFHQYDLPVILHSCGGIEAAIPAFLDAGFDGLNPMEVKAGCDIFKFADMYADRLIFVGGLDVRIIETGDRDLIKKETIKLIDGMKQRNARFVFGSDHSISAGVAYDDYQYMLEVYRDNMRY